MTETRCDIIIDFFDKNALNIGHISFHLSEDDKSKRSNRFHAKNKSKYYTFKLNKTNKQEFIKYTPNSSINPLLKISIDCAIKVLNQYFNPNSVLYLGKYPPGSEKIWHICRAPTISKLNRTIKTRVPNTRKVYSSSSLKGA